MYSIALRFTDNFAPIEGTIKAHEEIINKKGCVWYGKLGHPVSDKIICSVLDQDDPKILLILSGGNKRYWAYISDIKKERPSDDAFPSYYQSRVEDFKTWFCVNRFEHADKNVMSKWRVVSSKAKLSDTSKHSMSPYFFIEKDE